MTGTIDTRVQTAMATLPDSPLPAAGPPAPVDAGDWAALAAGSVEPSGCCTRDWLGGVLSAVAPSRRPWLIAPRDAGRLQAVAALERHALTGLIPLPMARSWQHDLIFSGLPLVEADRPDEAVARLLQTCRDDHGARAVLFSGVPADGPFAEALARLARRHDLGIRHYDTHRRAALTIAGESYDAWFDGNFARKRRKEYRRLKNRLAEAGDFRLESWSAGHDLDGWIDQFLTLEAAGWKGRRGTALNRIPEVRAGIAASLRRLAETGSLMFWRMSLDGAPAAMLFAIVNGDQAWLGKIAHDEALARFSPGVLLVLEATRDLLARPGLARVDSCAVPDHPMIDNIWRDRIAIADAMIATPGTSPAAFAGLAGLESAHRTVRRAAKSLHHAIRKGVRR